MRRDADVSCSDQSAVAKVMRRRGVIAWTFWASKPALRRKPGGVHFGGAAGQRVGQQARAAAGQRPPARTMARVEPQARHAAGTDHGRPVRQHGPRPFPGLCLGVARGAREPVLQYAVQGLDRCHGQVICFAAQFGATGHPHAIAQAADGDLEAFVHQGRTRANVGVGFEVAHWQRDRVAVHRLQGQLQAVRAQQGRGAHRGTHDDGIEALVLRRGQIEKAKESFMALAKQAGDVAAALSLLADEFYFSDESDDQKTKALALQIETLLSAFPKELAAKLNADAVSVLNSPKMKPVLNEQGWDVVANTQAQFTARIRDEIVKWRKVVQDSGAKVD